MTAHETKTFKSGNSEAVRLPKGIGFGVGTDLRVEREGNRIVLTPIADPVAEKRKLRQLVADLRAIGRSGDIQDREEARIEFPDRPELY